jgi:hypothetical protein
MTVSDFDRDPRGWIERIEELSSAYGKDPSRWPSEEWSALSLAVEHSEPVRKALDAALEISDPLDALLDARERLSPSADLLRRVAEIPLGAKSRFGLFDWLGVDLTVLGWKPATALTLAMALGVATGALTPEVDADSEPDWQTEASVLAFGQDLDLE